MRSTGYMTHTLTQAAGFFALGSRRAAAGIAGTLVPKETYLVPLRSRDFAAVAAKYQLPEYS